MSQRPTKTRAPLDDDPSDTPQPADFATKVTIYKDIADVTWRMFVPSVGGAIAGVVADRVLHTKPLWTIVGVTVGFTMVVFLVWRQIRATKVPNKDSK